MFVATLLLCLAVLAHADTLLLNAGGYGGFAGSTVPPNPTYLQTWISPTAVYDQSGTVDTFAPIGPSLFGNLEIFPSTSVQVFTAHASTPGFAEFSQDLSTGSAFALYLNFNNVTNPTSPYMVAWAGGFTPDAYTGASIDRITLTVDPFRFGRYCPECSGWPYNGMWGTLNVNDDSLASPLSVQIYGDAPATSVPEPSTALLLGVGLLSVGGTLKLLR